jgi:hypothetical protein
MIWNVLRSRHAFGSHPGTELFAERAPPIAMNKKTAAARATLTLDLIFAVILSFQSPGQNLFPQARRHLKQGVCHPIGRTFDRGYPCDGAKRTTRGSFGCIIDRLVDMFTTQLVLGPIVFPMPISGRYLA